MGEWPRRPWGLRLDRRRFLAASAATVLAACTSRNAANERPSTSTIPGRVDGPHLGDDPFGLGVASGDPRADGVTLWTRLAGDDLGPQRIPVAWELATDERFGRVVRHGTIDATADLGHAIHIDLDGLDPGSEFHYRFHTREHTSPTGRTRTAPARHERAPLRFAFASCQEYQEGWYTAYRDAAAGDLDLLVHLGDYIYEHGVHDDGVRRHEGGPVTTLDDYRRRYATYRSDPDLRAAHAACPWVITWDDHEVADNYTGLVAGALADPDPDPLAFARRRTAAYRAWYEHQPVRVAAPTGADLAIHRAVPWGSDVLLLALDTRQYRSEQTCSPIDIGPMCDEMRGGGPTVLGDAQHAWLERELDASAAMWNVLANQVLFAPMTFGPERSVQLDGWDGYPAARRRVTQFLDDHGVRNPVFITGDIHLSAVNDVRADVDDAASRVVATEFVGTSISSGSDAILAGFHDSIVEQNPHLRWIEHDHRGYVVCEAGPDAFTAEYRFVDDARDPESRVRTARRWAIEPGRPVAEA